MNEKILIFGNGYLGNRLKKYFQNKGCATDIASVDIRNFKDVTAAIKLYSPNIVFNCAAKTNLDWCELNKEECASVNIGGAVNVALGARQNNAYLIHFGSFSIFDSKGSTKNKFSESSEPNPTCYYSYTKAEADKILKDFHVLILRLGVLISSDPIDRNYLIKIASTYNELLDEKNSFTCVDDLLTIIPHLIKKKRVGIYHIANTGSISPYGIYKMAAKYIKKKRDVRKINRQELNKKTMAKRSCPLVSGKKIRKEGIKITPIKEAIREHLKELKKHDII